MGIPGQSSDNWHTTGLPKDAISLTGGGVGEGGGKSILVLAEKLSALLLSLWGVCLWRLVSAGGALCSKGDTDPGV